MKTLHFSVRIKAPKEKVWKVLWEEDTYRTWSGIFSSGSYAISDWKEGSRISFLSPNGDGMLSTIHKKVPNELMSFKHLGTLQGGVEQPESQESRKWKGAMENYSLEETDGTTLLTVSMDIAEDHEEYFKKIFPKALEKIKALC
jgi:uncharacterized protein YndB with AHSA1/START domain